MSIIATLRAAISETVSLTDSKWFPSHGLGLGGQSTSGEWITPKLAMVFSAYFAAMRNISEDIGKMPRGVYQRGKDRREEAFDNPAQAVLDSPNEYAGPMAFFETETSHALGYHGGYSEILRDGRGRPVALNPIDPESVTTQRTETGALYYRVHMRRGGTLDIPPDDMLHIHGLGYDAITGFIISAVARESLGFGVAAQRYSSAFFGNGAVATGVIEYPGALTPEARANLRDSFEASHKGAGRAHGTVVLSEGAQFKPTSFDSQKAMLIDALNWAVEDVARWFRIPPHKLQQLLRATFTNIEHQNIEYVVDCLSSWVTRWEGELNRKLFARGEPYYVKFNMNGLLRGDLAARAAFYHTMLQDGVLNRNEVRTFEDWNPVPGGEVYNMQLNMAPANELPPPKAAQSGASALAIGKMAGAVLGRLYAREAKASTKWGRNSHDSAIAQAVEFVEAHARDYESELGHIAEAVAIIHPLSPSAIHAECANAHEASREALRDMMLKDGQYFTLADIMQRRIDAAEMDGLAFVNRCIKRAAMEADDVEFQTAECRKERIC